MKNKLAIVIAGPTGVGKTEVAIRIAVEYNTGIISADSRQIYRELTTGTAAPGPAQLKKAPHHLLQHRSVKDYYNASMFEMEALAILDQIFSNSGKAVIAGGSGLYIQAICQGIDDIPTVDPGLREQLKTRLRTEGLERMRFELKKLDPVSYRDLDLNNPSRIMKALEISLMTGRPYSSFLTRKKKKRDFSILKIGLNLERDILYRRINDRVDKMMENGLLEEVNGLLPVRDRNALNTVGYKELFAYLDGDTTLGEAVSLIKRNTRHYARRQITWFNRDPEIIWFDPGSIGEILNYISGHVKAAG
jgi:tRNA dimethylallyltransferase